MAFLVGAFGKRVTSSFKEYLQKYSLDQCDATHEIYTVQEDAVCVYAGSKRGVYNADSALASSVNNNQGVLVGKLFDKEKFERVNNTISLKKLTELTEKYWGRYVGVFYDKHTRILTLVRDPLGEVTLFYKLLADGTILFSSELVALKSICEEFLDEKLALDFNYFAEFILSKNYALPTTPFSGVQELSPATSVTVNLDGTVTENYLWDSAVTSSKSGYIHDTQSFEEEMRDTLLKTLKAWTSESTGVCVELSGGTDSSALTMLLREVLPRDKKLIAVNYIDSKIASSNEIEYAQEIANLCDTELFFVDWQTTSLLDPLPTEFKPNRPSTFLIFNWLSKQLVSVARDNNCSELINGQGGDHVFLSPPPLEALADLWLERGFQEFGSTMKELSGFYRVPWSNLLKKTISTVGSYYFTQNYSQDCSQKISDISFLTPAFREKLYQHEFYLKNYPVLKKLYPAKYLQLENLYHGIFFADRFQRDHTSITTHPLFSQPVVELALKIPTYQSFRDSYDRIFLRKAADPDKKTKALWRTIKGHTTSSMVNACKQNADTINVLIREGQLVKSGMLDTGWLDKQIVSLKHGQGDNLWPILHTLVSQMWLNQWDI